MVSLDVLCVQAAAFATGGTRALMALLSAKAARSDAKLALAEVLIYQVCHYMSERYVAEGDHCIPPSVVALHC